MNKLLIGILLIFIIILVSCVKDKSKVDENKNSSGLRGGERYSFVFFIIELLFLIDKKNI